MTVIVVEGDLIWSTRVSNACRAMGHDAVILDHLVDPLPSAEVAVLGLGARGIDVAEAVARLREAGMYVIVHAGHKEKSVLEAGKELGADRVATNSEVAHKLGDLLAGAIPNR